MFYSSSNLHQGNMSFLQRYCGYGAVVFYIVAGIAAYHFDVNNIIMYEHAAGNKDGRPSYFGYSVALWNTTAKKSWIFIGAPRAALSSYKTRIEPGDFFKCQIGKICEKKAINIDSREGHHDGSWFGASLNIGRVISTDILVVCAPRWLDKHDKSGYWLMRGRCYRYSAKRLSSPLNMVGSHLGPLDNTMAYLPSQMDPTKTQLYFGMGLSGFSTHLIRDNENHNETFRYLMGCPGVYLSHGTPILSDNNQDRTSFIIPNPRKDDTVYEDGYSGYAVTTGFYFGSKRVYVAGAPRGINLHGQIILFDFPELRDQDTQSGINNKGIKLIHGIETGAQLGEYFGSALATCDIDGDGRDDLLVGAPQWSKKSDEGRIYIFRGNTKINSMNFKDTQTIDGEFPGGRFGSAITCLGDIDYDGYSDVAVGAPYNGNGAVYIYHGGKDGLRYTQKIDGPNNTKGFGISISEPRDIDNNHYADIAIGAYISGHVTVIRSKRVVRMTVTLSSYLSREPLGHNATSFLVRVCSAYKGAYAPPTLNVTKELKINEVHQRAEINISGQGLRSHEYNDTLTESHSSCKNFTINIKKRDKNFLHPLKLLVTQRLNTINESGMLLVKEKSKNGSEHFCHSCAVAYETHQEVQSHLDIPFAVNSGNDTVPNSNLIIHMMTNLKNNNSYVIGSTAPIWLDIVITNVGEEAHFTKAVVSIPTFIQLRVLPSTCSRVKEESYHEITCVIADLLGHNKTENLSLALDSSRATEQFYLNATAITQSIDIASGDHQMSLLINCVARPDIRIAGKSDRDYYRYTLREKKKKLENIMFQHTYEIKNHGVTPITEALFSVSIPTHWKYGGKDIEIVRVNKVTDDLKKRELYCANKQQNIDTSSSSSDTFTMTEMMIGNDSSVKYAPQTVNKFTSFESKALDAYLNSRTLYINCSNPLVKWKTITCKLEHFRSTQSGIKIVLAFDLLLQNFTSKIIQEKNFIFFVTNASTRITMAPGIIQTISNKSNSILIGTMFIQSELEYKLPRWLIPVSVSVGLLLLVFIILGLLKFGFFKRSKKTQLEAYLKENDHITRKVVLETTSSTEALDTT